MKRSTLSMLAMFAVGTTVAKVYGILQKKIFLHFFNDPQRPRVDSNNIWKYLNIIKFNTDNPSETYEKLINFYNPATLSYFMGKDSIKIAYKTFAGQNQNKAIVLLTGRRESSLKYAELIYNLSGLGYPIYTYDHRGQGFSGRLTADTEIGHVENFHDYVDDLQHFYEHHVKIGKHKELYLLAHSMGGAIATLFLQENPAAFTKAILLSPMHEINTGKFPEWAAKTIGDVNVLIGRDSTYATNGQGYNPENPFLGNDTTHSLLRFNYNKYINNKYPEIRLGSPSYKWLSESINATSIMKANASSITTPTLIIEAEKDTVVVNEAHAQICANSDTCALISIKGALHEAYNETDEIRVEVLKNIVQFIV